MTKKWTRWLAAHGSLEGDDISGQVKTDFTINAMLEHPQFQANVTVNFHQRLLADGYFSLYPSISVGMTLPRDSPIFNIVQNGDLNALQSMLSQGKASLRDRNSDGTPLLHVSRYNRPLILSLLWN